MNTTPSVVLPIERLRQLGRDLAETAEHPWSNIDSWIAKATPLIRHDWPAHFDDFQRAAKKPRQYITLPGNDPTATESQNRQFALESKNRLGSFIDGLLQIGQSASANDNSEFARTGNGLNMYRRIGVMIGSPGDATDERQAITDTVARWNAANSSEKKIILEAVKWETHATPGLRGRPQGMINEELIPLSDCLIAVFRSRAGSPTGKDISGTIEEVREFMRQGKYVALYFYEGHVPVGSIDPDQLKAVNVFKKEIQQHGITDNYGTVDELSAKLSHHLTGFVRAVSEATQQEQGDRRTPVSANPIPVDAPSTPMPLQPAIPIPHLIVADSGQWALIGTQFYDTQSVRRNADGKWVVQILSQSAEDDAHLNELKPHAYGRSRPIPFAHRNDGWLVTVQSVEGVSQGGEQLWTITLAPEDVEYGGSYMDMTWQTESRRYTPDDFARLRAGRILLNNPPPLQDNDRTSSPDRMHEAMLESNIRGSNNPVTVDHCIVQAIHRSMGGDPETFMRLARLASIYFLRAGGAVEQILDLTFGPINEGKVHVRFRGRRRRIGSNVEPSIIELEGDCPLE